MRAVLHSFYVFALVVLSFPSFSQNNPSSDKSYTVFLQDGRLRQELLFNGMEKSVQICNLTKGETYSVWANQMTANPSIRLAKGGKAERTFDFVATADCMDFVVKKDAKDPGCTKPLYLSIGCKSCKVNSSSLSEMANLSVVQGVAAQTLIQDVFIGGGCFDVTNVTSVGSPAGKGTFASGSSSINIEEGVILSSGNVTNAPGPNNSNSAGNVLTGAGTDFDLSILANAGLYDIGGLEFDFKPTIGSINFQFAFASEEYCEFVNSGFNDVFGFFISGPGISGGFSFNGANIAVIPGTINPITINNVNHLLNSGYFVPNQGNCGATTNMSDIQFDGYTTVLSATANVIPCETYHIRLMIADAGDGIYDSAVFLKANSFSAGGQVTAVVSAPLTGTNLVYEGCSDGSFIFTRVGGNLSLPFTINYTISPNSTATPGVDYVPIPGSITIPPGQTTFTLPVNVFADNIIEGIETIILNISNACSCSSQMVTLQISDKPPLGVTMPNQNLCAGTPLFLAPDVTGGVGNLSYSWSNGQNTPAITVVPNNNTTYTVTVTDQCNQTVTASSSVSVIQPPSAVLSGSGFICAGSSNSINLSIAFTGTGPWTFVYTKDGVPQPPITTGNNPYTLTVNEPATYGMLSVETVNGNCQGPAIGVAPILISTVSAIAAVTPATCAGNGTMAASGVGGIPPYNYAWSNGFPNLPTAIGLAPGTYTVTISDAIGCTATATGTITQAPTLTSSATALTQVTCTNPQGGSISTTVGGGTPGYTYNWSGGGGTSANPTGLGAGTYTVTITDALFCTSTASATIIANNTPPTAAAVPTGMLNCNTTTTEVSGAGSSTGTGISYQWTGPGISGTQTAINATVNQSGNYILTVTNSANGCTASATANVAADQTQPTSVATGGLINCTNPQISISGTGSSTGSNFSYQWTGPGIQGSSTVLNPSVNQSGTYVLTVSNQTNGCTSTASTQVTANLQQPVATGAAPLITCVDPTISIDGNGSSTGAGISYLWTTPNGNILLGETTLNPEVNQPGNYTLTVTNAQNGCTAAYTVQVSVDANTPVSDAGPGQEINCFTSTPTLNGNASTGPNFSFAWTTLNGNFSSGENTLTPVVNAPGTYTLTVTNTDNGCTVVSNVQVTDNSAPPVITLANPGTVNCFTNEITLNGSGSATGSGITYSWTTPDGNIVDGENTLNPLINEGGTYTLLISNTQSGCSSSETVTVDQNTTLPTATVAPPVLLTCTTPDQTLDAGGSSAGSDFVYQWTLNGNPLSGASSTSLPVNLPGVYQILVTNQTSGCTSTASVQVNQNNALPDISAGTGGEITCTETTIDLDVTLNGNPANYDIVWTTPDGNIFAGGNTLTPTVDAGGIYNLLVTDPANGCTATASATVTVDANIPVPSIVTNGIIDCFTPTMTLDGTGSTQGPGITFSWSTTNGNIISGQNTLNPVVDQAGTYILTISDTNNDCESSASVVVDLDKTAPAVNIPAVPTLDCNVTSNVLNGTVSNLPSTDLTWLWTTGNGTITGPVNGSTANINAPGTYNLLVTNIINGCTGQASLVVSQNNTLPVLQIATPGEITCATNSVSLDGTGSSTGANFIYSWTTATGNIVTGANTLNPLVNEPGTYNLLITNNANGCTKTSQVVVNENVVNPQANAGPTSTLTCAQTQLSLGGTGSTGAEFQYQWVGPGIVSGGSTLTPTINAPGTYNLTITNLTNACTATSSVTIAENTVEPDAEAGTSLELSCSVGQISLNGNGSSTGANFQYLWTTPGGNIVSGANTLTPVIDQPGTYNLTVTNLMNGCTSTDFVVVEQDEAVPSALITPPAKLTCAVTSLTLSATASQGTDFQYQWTATGGGSIVSGATTLNPVVNSIGTYILAVTNTSNGCTKTTQTTVQQDIVKPTANAGQPFVMDCFNPVQYLDGSASTGSAALSYQWTTANGYLVNGINSAQPGINQPGTYTLTVTNSVNGCTATASVIVTRDGPSAQPQLIQPPCYGDKGAINIVSVSGGSPPYLYSIDAGDNFGTTNSFKNLAPALYTVVVQDTKGCVFEQEMAIEQPDELTLVVEPHVEMKLGDSYQINAQVNFPLSEIAQITWTPSESLSCDDCLQPIATPSVTTTYKVTVVNNNGCKDSAPILLLVNKSRSVYVPTAFSPNGDGTNDKIFVFTDSKSVAKIKSFMVFNRWGEAVWQFYNFPPNDPDFGWDGQYRGQPMDPAVFTWFAEIEFIDGKTEVFKGDVSLMK